MRISFGNCQLRFKDRPVKSRCDLAYTAADSINDVSAFISVRYLISVFHCAGLYKGFRRELFSRVDDRAVDLSCSHLDIYTSGRELPAFRIIGGSHAEHGRYL